MKDKAMETYKNRLLETTIQEELEIIGAVVIEGPKWCGKTTTAKQFAASVLDLSRSEKLSQYLELQDIAPDKLLEGKNPRLVDEWQLAPKLWDTMRSEIDRRNLPGLFLLTGSTTPPKDGSIFHSGAGRFSWVKMRPMSLFESGESSGEVSLKSLFKAPEKIAGINALSSLDDLAFVTCRGGWPRAVKLNNRGSLRLVDDYFDAVVRSDISSVDGVQRSPERAAKLLWSLARHQGTQASLATILEDMGEAMRDDNTLALYLDALRRIFVVEDAPAWNPNLRSKTAIRTSPTRYFVDPSIAIAALGLGPSDLIQDLNTFGLIFETLCMRDLRIYAETLQGKVYHYRDKSGLECDAVIHLRNGSYGLIEVKLGGERAILEGVKCLQELEEKIDSDKMRSPAFKMVLTGTGEYAYRRGDGIYVVPIGCLKN